MAAYASQVLAIARSELGYKEKASNAQLESKTANAGSNNWNKFAAFIDSTYPNFYNGKKNGYAWCDIFVDYCFLKAFGLNKTLELTGQSLNSYGAGCEGSYYYYKAKGRVGKTPKIGAQIFFGTAENNLYHTGIVTGFDSTYVYTIEGNTSNMVAERSYKRTGGTVYGYGYPNYDGETAPVAGSGTTTPSTGAGSTLSKKVQWTGYTAAVVTARVWAGATYDALKSIGALAKGTKVDVCSSIKDNSGADWYYVCINGNIYGFVPAANITKTNPNATAPAASSGTPNKTVKWTGAVTASSLNVRTWAGTEYGKLKSVPSIPKGTKVGVCDTVKAKDGSNWYYVLINNKTYGFVHSAYVK